MRRTFGAALIAAAVLSAGWSGAVEIEQGQTYPGGTLLESARAGVSVRVPEGWHAGWPAQSHMVILAAPHNQGYVFLYVDELDQASARKLMSENLDLGDGITLQPQSIPAQPTPGLLSADYRVLGVQQTMYGRVHTRLGEFGVGASFLAVAAPGQFDQIAAVALQLATQTAFQQPARPVPVQGGSASWQEYMRGRYVVRLYTATGYTEEEHVWLCSDGTFHRSSSSGGFGGGASGAFASRANGRWQAFGETAEAGQLILQYGPGGESRSSTTWGEWTERSAGHDRVEYALELRDGKLFLNDRQWFRDTNKYCP